MLHRPFASYVLGALVAASVTSVAVSDDYVGGRVVTRIGDRCAQLGQGFVDVGNGICSRVSRSLRIYVGPRDTPMNAPANPWAARGASSAALRSDGLGMLPGATAAQHLRVRGSLDSYNPFR